MQITVQKATGTGYALGANLGNDGLGAWGAVEDTKTWELCGSGRVASLPVMAFLCVRYLETMRFSSLC